MIYTLFLTTVAVEHTLVAFLQHSKTHSHGLSCQFFQIFLKNRELKTTHNAFRDCRVHFFRQPLSKQLYTDGLDGDRQAGCNVSQINTKRLDQVKQVNAFSCLPMCEIFTISDVRCPLSDVQCTMSIVYCLMSDV